MKKISGKTVMRVCSLFVAAALLLNLSGALSGVVYAEAKKDSAKPGMPADADKYIKDGKLIGSIDPAGILAKTGKDDNRGKSLEEGKIIPGKIIVKLKAGTKTSKIKDLNKKYKVKEIKRFFAEQSALAEIVKKLQKEKEELEKNEETDEGRRKKEEIEKRIESLKNLDKKLEGRQKRSLKKEKEPNLENVYILEISKEADPALIAGQYGKNPAVEYAEPVRQYQIMSFPNDPYYSSSNSWGQGYDDLWGLKKINAAPAWDNSQGAGVAVAVVDTGLDYNHEDISGNVLANAGEIANNGLDDDGNGYADDVYGWDFFNSDNNPVDDNGHGTHVSGTIAATGNNSLGIIGVAPQAKIMAIKGLNQYGSGYTDQLASAIKYATDRGADVINASWGGSFSSRIIEDAVNYAHSKGCIFVAAAGNSESDGTIISPANVGNSIAVSAVDHNDAITAFSSYGPQIDVAAPGGESGYGVVDRSILSLRASGTDIYGGGTSILNTNYYLARGTSMAAPHVSGLAALVLSLHPAFTNEEVRQVIRKSAEDLGLAGFDGSYGFGRINAQAALQMDSACVAQISSPKVNEMAGEAKLMLNIQGTASCPSGMSNYKMEYAIDLSGPWTQIGATSSSEVANGSLIQWTHPGSGKYLLKLTVTDLSGKTFQDIGGPVYIDSTLKEGWPITTGGEIRSSPLISDLDGDGKNEIIFASSDGKIYILDGQGGAKSGWPVSTGDFMAGYHDPAVGDVDGDGNLDVVFKTANKIYVYKKNGTSLSGWPKGLNGNFYGNGHYSSPVLSDLDQDGKLEIITNDTYGKMHVFKSDGSYLAGWPKTIETEISSLLYNNPVVGDVDGDGFPEIIIKEYKHSADAGILHIFNRSGAYLPGWPKNIENGSLNAPVLGDIDKDGKLDIISGSYIKGTNYYNGQLRISAFDGAGNYLPGWPVTYPSDLFASNGFSGGFSLADINKDGYLEVLFTTSGYSNSLHALDRNGNALWHTSAMHDWIYLFFSAPVVADLNGDGDLEIALTKYQNIPEYTGRILVYDKNGNELSNLTKIIPDQLWSSPAIGDLDNDGKLEIAAGSNFGNLYVWNTEGSNDKKLLAWPTFQGNAQRTGTAPALSSEKTITSFELKSLGISGVIDENARTISATVLYGTEITGLIPTIVHTGDSINPASGAAQDFTSPITYTVTAEDGTTQDYIATITVAKNPAKEIISFSFDALGVSASINEDEKTINADVPFGTDIAALIPTIIHTGASVIPASGAAQDFTNPVAYTVTAEDGTSKTYTVIVNVIKSADKEITKFVVSVPIPFSSGYFFPRTGVINQDKGIIAVAIPNWQAIGDVLTANVAHTGLSVSPASGTAQNFASPVIYTVTAQDGSTKNYTVYVIKGGLRPTMLDSSMTWKKNTAYKLIGWIISYEYTLSFINKERFPVAYANWEKRINSYWASLIPLLTSIYQ